MKVRTAGIIYSLATGLSAAAVVLLLSVVFPVNKPSPEPIIESSILSIIQHDKVQDGMKTFHAYEFKWGDHYYMMLVVDGPDGVGMTVLK